MTNLWVLTRCSTAHHRPEVTVLARALFEIDRGIAHQLFLDEIFGKLDHRVGTHDPSIAEALAAIDFVPGMVVAGEAGEAICGCNFPE